MSAEENARLDIRRFVDEGKASGMVLGVLEGGEPRIFGYGAHKPNADTVFEIGSITKVFTALLLADMVGRGEVAADDAVTAYVPEAAPFNATLLQLATHHAGLARMPANYDAAGVDPLDPYAQYNAALLTAYLSGVGPLQAGTYAYSNTGYALLGQALARRLGCSYEMALQARIFQPLGMTSSAASLTPEMARRLAQGHDAQLRPVSNWNLNAMEAAGAALSTTTDLLTFLGAAIGFRESPLDATFTHLLSQRWPTPTPPLHVALGWHITASPGGDIIWHNGGTGGYRAFAGFNAATRRGAVILCDTSVDVDPIAFRLLQTRD